MTKQPGAEFPFAGNVLESLELMSKIWGASFSQMPGAANPAALASSLPSLMVPTLDVNELDKRITDLRAVEQWLALNASMLRTSIQALEVQRNTIATLRSLGSTLAAPPPTAKPAAAPPRSPSPVGAASPPAAASPTPRRTRRQAKESRPPNLGEMPLNPAAWWGSLQDQFARIAAAAAGETPGKAPAPEAETNKPAARRPPTKRTS